MDRLGTKRIETDRLILRRFTIEDAEPMFQNWASDPEVTKFLTWQPHQSVAVTKELISLWVSEYDKPDCYQWAIELKEIGEPIGSIAVVFVDERTSAAEMGYCLSRAHWGRGLMPEALRAVMDFLFDEVGFKRVCAKHDAENPKSGRVMQKAGMRLEGVHRRAGFNNRGVIDVVVYGAILDDRKQP